MTTGYVESFRELRVDQRAREVSLAVFRLSKGFPREEMYALTDQIRRSSRSVGAQIAEAWGIRRYEKHFVSKGPDADAEPLETQHWVSEALDCAYLSAEEAAALNASLEGIGRMPGSMMGKSATFCGPPDRPIREDVIEYFVKK